MFRIIEQLFIVKMFRFQVLLTALTLFFVYVQGYKLKQVLILSRHNIRTPLTENLQYASSHKFPKWHKKSGLLTEKGMLVEGYLGKYFREWMVQQKLFTDRCPDNDTVLVYANTRQRTRESAKAFVKSAFKNCNITVFTIDSDEMDPIFNPVPLNTSKELRIAIVNEMQQKINQLRLLESFQELNKILNFNKSAICEVEKICDLSKDKTDIVFEIGIEPNVMGPLNLGNSITDSFLMSYYDGMPLEQVAWGQIKTPEQWRLLTKITQENQNVRFNSTILAREVSRPLLRYMLSVFERNIPPKMTLLMGHDSNLNPVMASLGLATDDLPGQLERTPVGGKLVFQKLEDDNGVEFLKVDFVYLSFDQIRNGTEVSMENPPLWFPMPVKHCSDHRGYCPWESFLKYMRSI